MQRNYVPKRVSSKIKKMEAKMRQDKTLITVALNMGIK
jgi:hypothetical protein